MSVEVRSNKLYINMSGEIDHHRAGILREESDEVLNRTYIKEIIFDFSGIRFMDSSGIGLIMGRYKKIKPMNGEIFVCNLGLSMQRIFKLSGLYKITKHSFEIDHLVNEEATYESK